MPCLSIHILLLLLVCYASYLPYSTIPPPQILDPTFWRLGQKEMRALIAGGYWAGPLSLLPLAFRLLRPVYYVLCTYTGLSSPSSGSVTTTSVWFIWQRSGGSLGCQSLSLEDWGGGKELPLFVSRLPMSHCGARTALRLGPLDLGHCRSSFLVSSLSCSSDKL